MIFSNLRGSRGMVSGENPEQSNRSGVIPPRGATFETPRFPRNTLYQQLRDLNERIAQACDRNDLNEASRLNAEARRLALDVYSLPVSPSRPWRRNALTASRPTPPTNRRA